jgi:drug/metabolite transporter (DMT)-like permease
MRFTPVLFLVAAAVLEVAGDAAIRRGLKQSWPWIAVGAASLIGYGVVVNQPTWSFNHLMGAYIAVFFVISQVIAYFAFAERPNAWLILGGSLIVAGGLIVQWSGSARGTTTGRPVSAVPANSSVAHQPGCEGESGQIL